MITISNIIFTTSSLQMNVEIAPGNKNLNDVKELAIAACEALAKTSNSITMNRNYKTPAIPEVTFENNKAIVVFICM